MLVSITTTSGSDWHQQIKDMKTFEVQECAVFVTGLSPEQRKELYVALEVNPTITIPFVHARHDMTPEEYLYFIHQWKTNKFNYHTTRRYIPKYELGDLKKRILIENAWDLQETDLVGYSGICLDIAHLEDSRLLYPAEYKVITQLLSSCPIGANHISASSTTIQYAPSLDRSHYSSHTFSNIQEFEYLKNYPVTYFGEYIALELENSIAEQLEVQKYIERLLP